MVHSEESDYARDVVAAAAEWAVPMVGGATASRILAAVRGEWQRNMSKALRAAAQAMEMSREDLADLLERDPRTVPLYVQVLWAAGMNHHDATLRAMGAVFAVGARASKDGNEEALEDAELALRALGGFTARHFRVLGALAEGSVTTGNDGNPNYREFMPDLVAKRAALRGEVTNQCLFNLAAAGLAMAVSVWNGNAYPITDLGRAVLRAAAATA